MGASLPKKYVLVVGLEGAGKTTVIYAGRLRHDWDNEDIKETMGYNYEEHAVHDFNFCLVDTPGDPHLADMITSLYSNIDFSAIIFVLPDEEDAENVIKARRMLHFYANEIPLRRKPIAVIVNRFHSGGTYQYEEYMRQVLRLDKQGLEGRPTRLFCFSVRHGATEVRKVYEWLSEQFKHGEASG